MQSQPSLTNNAYFLNLESTLSILQSQKQQIQNFTLERNKKYLDSLSFYQKYLKKQSQLLSSNLKHSQQRNSFYLQQVKNAWKNGISNRGVVLRSLARTNVMKGDAQEWIGRIGEIGYGIDGEDRGNRGELEMEESQLIGKYNQILKQYHVR